MLDAMASEDELLLSQPWHADLAADPFAALFRKHSAALRAAHQAKSSTRMRTCACRPPGSPT